MEGFIYPGSMARGCFMWFLPDFFSLLINDSGLTKVFFTLPNRLGLKELYCVSISSERIHCTGTF